MSSTWLYGYNANSDRALCSSGDRVFDYRIYFCVVLLVKRE
ncbi:hypothetical protein [Nostoc sp.]